MSYETRIVFLYGVPETPDIKNRLRMVEVPEKAVVCTTSHEGAKGHEYCGKCGRHIGSDHFCAGCGAKRKDGAKYCTICGTLKTVGTKMVRKEVSPWERYEAREGDEENHCMANWPGGDGIYIGKRLGKSLSVREVSGSALETPEVTVGTDLEARELLARLGITAEPRLYTIFECR